MGKLFPMPFESDPTISSSVLFMVQLGTSVPSRQFPPAITWDPGCLPSCAAAIAALLLVLARHCRNKFVDSGFAAAILGNSFSKIDAVAYL
jgi:hypothetical protein